ncbi:MAG TPA: VOC family protein [Vicinamibacterales bacterium]|nr:VOC family protein [Vicinamibacterales bacterium]
MNDDRRAAITRRALLQTLGVAAVGAPLAAIFGESAVFAQGRCMLTLGSPACNTSDIKPLFEPTGWKTIGLDHITFQVADYEKEAAFYTALMGWTPRSDDGKQAVLDIGTWGSVIFKPGAMDAPAGGGRGGNTRAVVESFCFVIDKWNAKAVEAELKKRGLAPVADHDGNGFESFHVKDPDGFDLQISNGNGLMKHRLTPQPRVTAKLAAPAPFESTGWKTVWLDHFSFSVTNYKESTSFYTNLLGWKTTYDEGSQNECLIGEVGDIIIRGGNPLDPNFGRGGGRGRGGRAAAGGDAADAPAPPAAPGARSARIDHISFGIAPWDTDAVKAELEKRGLRATIDTSSRHQGPDGTWVPDEIHTAQFKSYHTQTPNGYNLQISYVTHDNRLALPNAVKPKPGKA